MSRTSEPLGGALLLLVALSGCASALAPAAESTPTQQGAAPRTERATPPMTEAEWTTAAPGWRWVPLPMLFVHGDTQDQVTMDEVFAGLTGRDVRAVRVVGDYATWGACFDGEEQRLRDTVAHQELNTSSGAVAISANALARLEALESWALDQLTTGGFETVRSAPRAVELLEVPSTPERSTFRPRVTLMVYLPES